MIDLTLLGMIVALYLALHSNIAATVFLSSSITSKFLSCITFLTIRVFVPYQ